MKNYEKLDENTLKITEVIPQTRVETYIYQDLVARKDRLVNQKALFITKIDQDIADADMAISQANSLGVKTMVTEAVINQK